MQLVIASLTIYQGIILTINLSRQSGSVIKLASDSIRKANNLVVTAGGCPGSIMEPQAAHTKIRCF